MLADLPLMVACVVSLAGGGLFAWREQKHGASFADQQHALPILAFVAAMLLVSCLLDFSR